MPQLPEAASLKERLAATSQEWLPAGVPLLVLIALLAIIEIGAPGFATIDTSTVMLADTAVLFILAAGVTFVILLGGIDLSIQAVASLASVILAQLLPSWGLIAIPVAILAGIVSGAAGGFIHVR